MAIGRFSYCQCRSAAGQTTQLGGQGLRKYRTCWAAADRHQRLSHSSQEKRACPPRDRIHQSQIRCFEARRATETQMGTGPMERSMMRRGRNPTCARIAGQTGLTELWTPLGCVDLDAGRMLLLVISLRHGVGRLNIVESEHKG
jgi:hypothetical protein